MEIKYKLGQTLYYLNERGYLRTTKVVAIYNNGYIATQMNANTSVKIISPNELKNYYTGISQISTQKLLNTYP